MLIIKRDNKVQLVISIIFSGIAIIINYGISFALTPYIIRNIGTEAYGFVSLAYNFVSYFDILIISLNAFSTRFISVSYHKGDKETANRYFSSVFLANTIFATVITIPILIAIYYLEFLLNIPSNLVVDVKIMFILAFFNYLLLITGTVFTVAFYIKNRLDLTSLNKGISLIIKAFVLFALFVFFKPNVWYIGVGTVLAGVYVLITNIILSKKLTMDLKIQFRKFSFKSVKVLITYGIWNSINNLGNLFQSGLDLLVANIMISAFSMGQLSVVKNISSLFAVLYQWINQPFQPMFIKNYVDKNEQALIRDFKLAIKVSGLISNLAFAGFLAYGLYFYNLWIPNQDINLIYKLTVISISGCITIGAAYPLYYVYTLTLKMKVITCISLITGLLNFISMYILLKYTSFGLFAVVTTTTIVSLVCDSTFTPIYTAYCLNIKKFTFIHVFFRHYISCVVMSIVFCLIARIIIVDSWVKLILIVLISIIIGIIIHSFIMLNRNEMNRLVTLFKKRFV